MCCGQFDGNSLLGIHFIAKAISVNLKRLRLQGARESPDVKDLVMCIEEELGRS